MRARPLGNLPDLTIFERMYNLYFRRAIARIALYLPQILVLDVAKPRQMRRAGIAPERPRRLQTLHS